jgi:hypothetical protein
MLSILSLLTLGVQILPGSRYTYMWRRPESGLAHTARLVTQDTKEAARGMKKKPQIISLFVMKICLACVSL